MDRIDNRTAWPLRARLQSLMLGLLVSVGALSAADQYPPGKLTFQGYLTDAKGVPLGTSTPANATVAFRLYRNPTGTNKSDILWGEQQSVTVNSGFFNALLGAGNATGSTNDFFTNNLSSFFIGPDASDRYLGVTVIGQGGEITPRIQFFSSPFAYLSKSTATLVNESSVSAINIVGGKAGINLSGAPSATLDVGGTVKATTFVGDGSNLTGFPVSASAINGTFTTAQIADGAITGAKFSNETVTASQLLPNAVTSAKLSPDAAATVVAQAGSIGLGGTILSSNKLNTALLNMGYVNVGRASVDGEKWSVKSIAANPNSPTPRFNRIGPSDNRAAATIWTGTKWIMYSGMNVAQNGYVNDGGMFDPALNTWTPVSTVNAPIPRDEISFLWTGTKGLFWGGHNGASLANGGVFDPVANSWTTLNPTNEPSIRNRFRAVWSGTEMIVWGGAPNHPTAVLKDGKIFNPSTNGWRAMSTSPLTGRRDFNAVWTGTEMLIWGGVAPGVAYWNDGALYNPVTDTWRLMSTVNAPTAREQGLSVWTGKEFIVWGGNNGGAGSDGGRYDVATDTWIPFNTPNSEWLLESAAFWNGSKVFFIQGRDRNLNYVNDSGFTSGWSFDPNSGIWTYLPVAPVTQTWMPFTWTGNELLTFSTWRDGSDRSVFSFKPDREMYFYTKVQNNTDAWTVRATVLTSNAPPNRAVPYSSGDMRSRASVWTGSKWILWGDQSVPLTTALRDGAIFDPANNSWKMMSFTNAPSRRFAHQAVWTGTSAIFWGGFGPTNFIGDGASYNLANDTWTNLSSIGAPSPRARHSAVWTGTQMLVWGGATNNAANGAGVTNNGARYTPATDTWSAMASSPLTNRCDFCAQWTGTEMLVWGGGNSTATNFFGDGALYNPTSNTWRKMNPTNAPSARMAALGVWTGTEFIVWGGHAGGTNGNDGGRYNPATDTWVPFNTGNYGWQFDATAVWTGSKVLYAGGQTIFAMVNTTGKGGITYDPVTGIVGTLPVAPINQRAMPFAWTGTELLTFGSWDDFEDRTVLSYKPQP